MEEGAAYLSPPKFQMRDAVVGILQPSDDVGFVQIKDVICPMSLESRDCIQSAFIQRSFSRRSPLPCFGLVGK